MGQQMSTADESEDSFKNVISRMLQEADEEEEDSNKGDNSEKNSSDDSGRKLKIATKDSTKDAQSMLSENSKKNLTAPTNDDVYKKAHLEPNDEELSTDTKHSQSSECKDSLASELKMAKGLESEGLKKESEKISKSEVLNRKDDQDKNVLLVSQDGSKTDKVSNIMDTVLIDGPDVKQKSGETVCLKDKIDNLITSCLSSKSADMEVDMKNTCPPVPSNQNNSPRSVKDFQFNQNNSHENIESRNMDNSARALSAKNEKDNQNNSLKIDHSLKAQDSGKETFQTLIEKVLDNSLQKPKANDPYINSVDSNRQSMDSGSRQMSENRMINRNKPMVKNEMCHMPCVNDTSDKNIRNDIRSDNMSINKSKVVFLKDHIEKVLEKSFQNSGRRDSDENKPSDRSQLSRQDDNSNSCMDQRFSHRERSHSIVSEPPMSYRRDKEFNTQHGHHQVKRHSSMEAIDAEYLSPPKLIKVTEMYQEAHREHPRYTQPPRIDTGDGNSRGSFKSSPGSNYNRSPLEQSPVSPYYNNSPNSWQRHSPREPISVNLSPNSSVPSPNYSPRYPHSPGMGHHPNVARYGLPHGTPSHVSQHQVSPSHRNYHSSKSIPPHSPYASSDHRLRYQSNSVKVSPVAQHMNPNYIKQHSPMMSANLPNDNAYHSKHEMSAVSPFQQMPPRATYPTSTSQMISSRALYQEHNAPHMPQAKMPPHSYQLGHAAGYQHLRPTQVATEHHDPGMNHMRNSHQSQQVSANMPHVRHSHMVPEPHAASLQHMRPSIIPGDHSRNSSHQMRHPEQPTASMAHMRHLQSTMEHPGASMHHARQPQILPDHPSLHHRVPQEQMAGTIQPYPSNNRNSSGFQDKAHYSSFAHQGIHKIPHVPVGQPYSQYRMEENTKNPAISSAMALAPGPTANFIKQQPIHKQPQLYPSSPPIPSAREFSSQRNSLKIPIQPAERTAGNKYAQPVKFSGSAGPSQVSGPEQAIDFSCKKDTDQDNDPTMQPLDLTCKDKPKPVEINKRQMVGKGYTGFEHLSMGIHDKRMASSRRSDEQERIPNTMEASRIPSIYQSSEPSRAHSSQVRPSSVGSFDGSMYNASLHGQKYGNKIQSHVSVPHVVNLSDDKNQGQSSNPPPAQHVQQENKKAANVSRHEPIQNILGNHSPSDILYLICRLCGQTYGSPYGFRKHFRNQHGFEPRSEHTIVQTISETKTALRSPPSQIVPPAGLSSPQAPEASVYQHKIRLEENSSPNAAGHQTPDLKELPRGNEKGIPCETASEISRNEQGEDFSPTEHGGRKYLECHECGQTFQLNDFGAYKRHCRQHGQPKMNPFDTDYNLDHKDPNGDDNIQNSVSLSEFRCSECNSSFNSDSKLQEHILSVHTRAKLNSTTDSGNSVESENKDSEVGSTINVKKRIIEDFHKTTENRSEVSTKSSKSYVTKSAADSMVTTASPDSSSDMVKLAIDSQLASKMSDDKNLNIDKDSADINSCDSALPKDEDSDYLYLHKKFGSKRKFRSTSSDIDSKMSKTSPGLVRSTSTLSTHSTNSCDSYPSGVQEDKSESIESDVEKAKSNDDVSTGPKVSTNSEARHQLPFVWDRVTRSQVGRKQTKANE